MVTAIPGMIGFRSTTPVKAWLIEFDCIKAIQRPTPKM